MNLRNLAIRTLNLLGAPSGLMGGDKLTENSIIRSAERKSGLSDMPDDRFRLPLRLLLNDYRNDAKLTFLGKLIAKGMLTNHVANRIRMKAQIQQVPEVTAQRIVSPVFVVGLPRSGTTLLYNLLCLDTSRRPLMFWESCSPTNPEVGGKKDKRLLEARKTVRGLKRALPELRSIHDFNADGPDECTGLLLNTFMTPYFRGRLPGYREWLFQVSKDEIQRSYQEYEQQLQILQYGQADKTWILKSPSHLFGLSSLLEQFPDASVIYLRRDIAESTASLCSLTRVLDTLSYRDSDLFEIGQRTLGIVDRLVAGGLEAVESRNSGRILSVEYENLTKDPVGTIENIYSRFEIPFEKTLQASTAKYIAANPRGKKGTHRYRLSDFGLSSADLERFSQFPLSTGRSV